MTTSARLELGRILNLDPYLAPFPQLRFEVEKRGPEHRKQLLSLCRSFLADLRSRAVEEDRVSAVKLLVALLPDSANEIEDWLTEHSLEHVHEVHFSLFCFLDEVVEIPSLDSYRPQIASLVEDYLAAVQSEDAFAAWMAGDLLGDHWPTVEGLPLLLRLATGAKYPAGRKGAIHGLAHLLDRVEDGSSEKNRIIALLERISKEDADHEVIEYAAFVLRNPNTS
jgi:hypothetical protein